MNRRMSYEDRRQALVQAAIRVIARGGVPAATTRAIVAEARMPLGAFHYVFASRDELLSEVVRTITDGERIAAELALPAGVPVQDAVEAALVSYLELLIADPDRELALTELSLHGLRHDPALARRQHELYFLEMEAVLGQLAERCGVRWSEPLPELARRLIVVTEGLTGTWLADRDTDAARAVIRSVASWVAGSAERVAA
ncbi:TetR/AcrR family transcriptional regulator [Protaetiibacter intestinalis]|uniref:TetR family transcriptional regulator n=1 Tax=Protaetiibacter intestinalis TaxID=2419774 RepID=A0A387B1V6_9MICO|nr:TetR family transcriptional regulator [Protaetiibacter intestinalis]AYF97494.1 TetR family transcriptional regulator [Protaetiibacter intestinalis]